MTSSTRAWIESVGTDDREPRQTVRDVASAYLHGAVRVDIRTAEVGTSIEDRLERAHEEGDLPPHTDPGLLARYLVTVSSGLAVQAGGGAGRAELHRVADIALRVVPSV